MDLHNIIMQFISSHPHPLSPLRNKFIVSASGGLHAKPAWPAESPSFLLSSSPWGSSDHTLPCQTVRVGGLEEPEGHGGGLLSGGKAHSVWSRDLAISHVVSKGHGWWCTAYVESEQGITA